MARIGIFSGTFDPVHTGHIAFCLAAQKAAALDRIVLLPEAHPRHKQPHTPFAHRVAMLRLAAKGMPQLEVLELADTQFSVATTLPQLQARFAHDELYLLLGSDVVPSLAVSWPGLETLLQAMGLVIGIRAQQTPHSVQGRLQALQEAFPAVPVRATTIASPHASVASSAVRAALPHAGQLALIPIVAEYITAYNLYSGAPA
ncbi:MAG TPA: nicotinate-nicotinamide nucleotide adenylyltransferase [Candidatus Saccharimonadales bacterium]|nr:nicotinate-nicotinamide nucleotide adenylyltransferase [Candidatus Saccharimonadales bacterium]